MPPGYPTLVELEFEKAQQIVLSSYEGVDDFYLKCHFANAVLAGLTGNEIVYGLAKSSILPEGEAKLTPHIWTVNNTGTIQDALEDYWYEHTEIEPIHHEFLIANFYEGRPIDTEATIGIIEATQNGRNVILEWRASRGV